MKIKSVLAIGAHPDDIEQLCGGTLVKYRRAGAKIAFCFAADGSAGHDRIPPEKLAAIRKKEAKKAADIAGASFHWLGLPDALLFTVKDIEFKVIDVIRQTKPDVIFTHNPDDFHPDHRIVSAASFNGALLSSLSNIKTEFPALKATPFVYYLDMWLGRLFLPTEFVDITDVFPEKIKMLKAHKSQIDWLKRRDALSIADFSEIAAKYRGWQCGKKYAEGFRPASNMPVYKTERLLP
jgi:N-acetylglucosamine malate deacetylase 1